MSKEKEIEKAQNIIQSYKNSNLRFDQDNWDDEYFAEVESFIEDLRYKLPGLRLKREDNNLIIAMNVASLVVDLYGLMKKLWDKND